MTLSEIVELDEEKKPKSEDIKSKTEVEVKTEAEVETTHQSHHSIW